MNSQHFIVYQHLSKVVFMWSSSFVVCAKAAVIKDEMVPVTKVFVFFDTMLGEVSTMFVAVKSGTERQNTFVFFVLLKCKLSLV